MANVEPFADADVDRVSGQPRRVRAGVVPGPRAELARRRGRRPRLPRSPSGGGVSVGSGGNGSRMWGSDGVGRGRRRVEDGLGGRSRCHARLTAGSSARGRRRSTTGSVSAATLQAPSTVLAQPKARRIWAARMTFIVESLPALRTDRDRDGGRRRPQQAFIGRRREDRPEVRAGGEAERHACRCRTSHRWPSCRRVVHVDRSRWSTLQDDRSQRDRVERQSRVARHIRDLQGGSRGSWSHPWRRRPGSRPASTWSPG